MHNDDAISRKSVIDVLIRNRVHFCDMVRITSELKELPSVTPKVEECEDAISRQAVLDTMSELNAISFYEAQEDSNECYHEIRKAMEQLPPVTPKPKMGRWIPVSERLPEEEGRYLTTIFNGIQYIMTCDYHPYSRCWFPDDECASDNVIAWMPLPEPYMAESEE